MKMYFKKHIDIKKIVYLALLTAQAIALSVVEVKIPDFAGIPGIKLGLANIITIVSLTFFSFSDTLLIVLIRCVIATLLISGPVMFLFSILGGVLSAVIMWVMLKYMRKIFSFIGISIAGAITQNVVQIIVACYIMSDLSISVYLPVLLVLGILTGCFVGICSTFMVNGLKKLNLIEYI